MMAMLAIGAWAETATFLYTGNGQAEKTVDGITITISKGNSSTNPATNTYSGEHFRIYKDNIITIDAGTNIIESVVFTCTSSSYASNWSGDEATAGTISVSGSEVTLSSVNATTTIITHSGAATRITQAVVTYISGETPAVAIPVINGETPFTESTEVTITCGTEGALIYYTIDGTEPTNQSTAYNAPFELTESATVKAIAYDANNNASSVATKEFVKEEPVVLTNVATVAEFNALADGTDFIFTGNLVATGQTGKYLYAQDSDNGILIYGTIDQTYSDLAEIPGGWTGKKTTFNGAPEAAEPAGLTAATEHVDLAPEEMTPAQVTLANAFKYAVIRGATIADGKAHVGDESVTIYDRFGVAAPTDGGVYDIIGVTGYYNTPQFMPLEYVAQAVDVAAPVITGETPFIGSTTVTITCATDGALIYYTTDGTEPTNQSTAYNAPFELTESATVKAIAYDTYNNASVVASKEFVKTPSISTAAEFDALPDNTTFVFNGNLVVSGQKNYYLFAQDATGGVLIYGNAGQTYTKGQVIPAGFTAKKTNYNGTIEMTNMTGMQAATETADLVAQELTISQFADNQNIYAVVKGATINGNTLTIGEETLAIYNRFGITFPTDDKTYDVYGVATIYSGNPQLLPLEFVEVVENTITYEAEQEGGTIAVALADGTQVESGVTKVAAGAKVTITATPAEGYKLSELVVKCGDEVVEFDNEVTPGRAAETHTFTMPEGEVSIEATFEEETPTGIESLSMENVKSMRFYNAAGVESTTPFNGVNIVVREMTDGSKSVIKVVK